MSEQREELRVHLFPDNLGGERQTANGAGEQAALQRRGQQGRVSAVQGGAEGQARSGPFESGGALKSF